jgi:hypothetical protein
MLIYGFRLTERRIGDVLFFIQTFILVIAFRDYRYNNMVSIFTARSESKYKCTQTLI